MDQDRLKKIKDVLMQVRNETDYSMGSPRALDHLLVHVVHLIDAILEPELEKEEK